MRNYLLPALVLFYAAYTSAQMTVNGSFVHDGITRTYSFYVPASYVPGQAVPLVLNLHGAGTNGAYQAQNRDFRPLADTSNFIVAHPDGTIEPFTSQRFWNYGNVLGSTVDDVGFLEALIDTISAHYTINQNRVYSAGMSNGSFMCYYLACQTDRFAAIGAVTGSMGVNMYNSCNPSRPTPAIHVHGTSDPINPYTGNSTSKAIEEVTLFWVNQNGCSTTPVITAVPNTITSDNATAERYLYTGGIDGHTVELFKITGGGHTWPGSSVPSSNGNTCMDFSASNELWRFFSQHELNTVASVQNDPIDPELKIWPNPTTGNLILHAENQLITDVTVIDMLGRVVERQTQENIQSVDLSDLKTGNYVLKISGENFQVMKKLVISPAD